MNIAFLEKCVKGNYREEDDGRIFVDGDVVVTDPIRKLPDRFSRVSGDFRFHGGALETLEGSPDIVCGDFDCSYNALASLEHGPKICYGNFNCIGNGNLALTGMPQGIRGRIILQRPLIHGVPGWEYLFLKALVPRNGFTWLILDAVPRCYESAEWGSGTFYELWKKCMSAIHTGPNDITDDDIVGLV